MHMSIMVKRKKPMEEKMSKKEESGMDVFKAEIDRVSQWVKDLFNITSDFTLTDEPSMKWKKKDIKTYMANKNIKYNSGDTKNDLLEKIKWNS